MKASTTQTVSSEQQAIEQSLTDTVAASFDGTEDPRLKTVTVRFTGEGIWT